MPLSPESQAILEWFTFDHLPQGDARGMAHAFFDFANDLASEYAAFSMEDPQMAVGFQRLLEAKDAFVRAAVAEDKRQTAIGQNWDHREPAHAAYKYPQRPTARPAPPLRYEYSVGGGDQDGDIY